VRACLMGRGVGFGQDLGRMDGNAGGRGQRSVLDWLYIWISWA